MPFKICYRDNNKQAEGTGIYHFSDTAQSIIDQGDYPEEYIVVSVGNDTDKILFCPKCGTRQGLEEDNYNGEYNGSNFKVTQYELNCSLCKSKGTIEFFEEV